MAWHCCGQSWMLEIGEYLKTFLRSKEGFYYGWLCLSKIGTSSVLVPTWVPLPLGATSSDGSNFTCSLPNCYHPGDGLGFYFFSFPLFFVNYIYLIAYQWMMDIATFKKKRRGGDSIWLNFILYMSDHELVTTYNHQKSPNCYKYLWNPQEYDQSYFIIFLFLILKLGDQWFMLHLLASKDYGPIIDPVQ